jgi:hypothetical protein
MVKKLSPHSGSLEVNSWSEDLSSWLRKFLFHLHRTKTGKSPPNRLQEPTSMYVMYSSITIFPFYLYCRHNSGISNFLTALIISILPELSAFMCHSTTLQRRNLNLNNAKRNITIFWDIATCRLLKVNQRFGVIYRLHFQGQINRARYQFESSCRWRCEVISTPWSLYSRGKCPCDYLDIKMGGES